jgi:hypothetical protein
MLLPLVFAAEPLETQVRNAFQTCELWVRTATELSLVEQLKKSLVSMLLLAFASILVFMGDILLSLFATTAVAAIMLCTIGWLLLDGWTFGLVEVIALHLLLGYSDYYVLHVTHSYKEAEAESRNERAAKGLVRIGVSVVSSASATLLCSAPLLWCELQLFSNLAVLIISNALTACLFSIGFLFTLLCIAGPENGCASGVRIFLCKLCSPTAPRPVERIVTIAWQSQTCGDAHADRSNHEAAASSMEQLAKPAFDVPSRSVLGAMRSAHAASDVSAQLALDQSTMLTVVSTNAAEVTLPSSIDQIAIIMPGNGIRSAQFRECTEKTARKWRRTQRDII